ncbi:hypothetical protein HYH03_003483 [Edaphochlamys debaryana]|uniref:Uncharacterized protein n=1 Tax=Edaphochlamys debaryana TaxID=47281 RepID=A0A836C4G6_9CHLO|nr:hypothetical protein HYH03_003483 [Edaphochlamys debaryana]|eukprot:KAG2498744.1 hypothetical protein HYH03_003483 [Edaphochlamys debaryana]
MLRVAIALGLLCSHAAAVSAGVTAAGLGQDSWGGDKLLSRWREMLSAKADKGEPAPSVFEQAFTATFSSGQAEEVDRTMQQYAELARWVEGNPQPSEAMLAFLPEFRNPVALNISRAAVTLYKTEGKDAASLIAALGSITEQLRATTAWRGYPATRRVLIGCLLKKRLDFGGRFPTDVQSAVDSVMLQLFQLHKTSAANRGAVQFFHVSKSGGTNLCQAAEANGCASQGFDTRTNCLIRDFMDQPRWVTANAHKYVQYRMSSRQALPWFVNFHTHRPALTCEQRRAYLLRHGDLNFYANEYTNPPGAGVASTMCDDFVNLIMIRNPHDRLKSQIGWIQKLYKEFFMDVDTQRTFTNRTTGFWERLMPAGVNNYYVRSLLGQRFFEFPINQVTSADAGLAKLAALQHDILLTLESKARNELAMRVGLGWRGSALKEGAIRSSTELGDTVALPLDYDTMLERNAPDMEVYLFAKELQALDSLLWNFVSIADSQLGPSGGAGDVVASSEKCGYVSLGSAEAAKAREERLRDVEIPAAAMQRAVAMAEAAAAAAAAALAPPGANDTAADAGSGGDGAVGATATSLRGNPVKLVSSDSPRKSIISINRRLMRTRAIGQRHRSHHRRLLGA